MSAPSPRVSLDETLLEQAVQGDPDALTTLLQNHGPGVRAHLSIGPAWQAALDADDVMQVTYVEAFLRIQSFEPRGLPSFIAWLQRLARNNLRDALRALQRDKRPPPGRRVGVAAGSTDSHFDLVASLGATSTTPSRFAMRAEARQILESAIDSLPPDYARVVRLCDLEGKSGLEVAAVMGRSRGAVVMLRSRAHDRLREILGSGTAFLTR